jgi:hypothetical protein
MAKWADFGISAVRFNARHTHIDTVKAMPDNGETFGPVAIVSRQDVARQVKQDTTFVTIFKDAAGNWAKGQQVYIVVIHGSEFIKTVRDATPVDNLDNLPEF